LFTTFPFILYHLSLYSLPPFPLFFTTFPFILYPLPLYSLPPSPLFFTTFPFILYHLSLYSLPPSPLFFTTFSFILYLPPSLVCYSISDCCLISQRHSKFPVKDYEHTLNFLRMHTKKKLKIHHKSLYLVNF